MSAEYILSEGNPDVVLQGAVKIWFFEDSTRNMLDSQFGAERKRGQVNIADYCGPKPCDWPA